MVDLPVSILRLTDAAVGKGVAGVIRIHAEVEVVTGVCHGQLEERMRELANMTNIAFFSTVGTFLKNRGTLIGTWEAGAEFSSSVKTNVNLVF